MGNYWLHRISNCWSVSKVLFDQGILTVGWQSLCKEGILEAVTDWNKFDDFTRKQEETSRSRWVLFNFAHMEIGDTVVIPLYDKEFAIAEIETTMQKISDLPDIYMHKLRGMGICFRNGFLYNETIEEVVDIGFFCKIKSVEKKERRYAEAGLQKRMKIRQTNANISDMAELVDKARYAKEAPKPFDDIIKQFRERMIEAITTKITPDNFENFICWLMERMGATSTEVLAKNESGKKNGADADVVAEFEQLGMKIYIQAKQHVGESDSWAVTQLSEYRNQKQQDKSGKNLYWVISTADKFDDTAKTDAENSYVRLINKEELADMILSVGVLDLQDFS